MLAQPSHLRIIEIPIKMDGIPMFVQYFRPSIAIFPHHQSSWGDWVRGEL